VRSSTACPSSIFPPLFATCPPRGALLLTPIQFAPSLFAP
jgi:hypothetical protein